MSFDYKNLHVEITRAADACVEEARVCVLSQSDDETAGD